MDLASFYKSKLRTAADAVASIPSGAKLSMGMAMGEPPALLEALAARARAGQVEGIRVYYFEATSIAGKTILDYELNDRIQPYCMFVTAAERGLIKRGMQDNRKVVSYIPNNFHQAPRLLTEEIGIDSFVCTVSPMDKHGYFSMGVGNDYSSKVARAAKHLIVEVNRHMPRVGGVGSTLHISEVEAVVEHDAPLLELPVREGRPDDAAIGKIIAGMVPNGACLQMGVGALPNLVCAELKDRKDLGVHTEALNPGLVELIEAGVVTNKRKALNTGTSIFTFAMGQKAMYDFIDGNPAVESAPVDYVNNPMVIAQNDDVVSINATIQIDLTGACNSEHMLGHQYSASGGQLDFVRGTNRAHSMRVWPSTSENSQTTRSVPGSSANTVRKCAKSICACRPGGVSKRTSKPAGVLGRTSRRKSFTTV